jgi:hypothetical protein
MSETRQLYERYDSGKNRRERRAGVVLIIIVTLMVTTVAAGAIDLLMQR